MNCLVTAGPTFEPLDEVRRLTNFSTGQLGGELSSALVSCGHTVTLLIGTQATYPGPRVASHVQEFSTTADLSDRLHQLAKESGVDAVFHAAAVSDFAFGGIWEEGADGSRKPIRAGKISTRNGKLWAELVPTPKIISELRAWFPKARLIGWKFEVDGTRDEAIEAGRRQCRENETDACVVNGPAYGRGFGLVYRTTGTSELFQDCVAKPNLFAGLASLLERQ